MLLRVRGRGDGGRDRRGGAHRLKNGSGGDLRARLRRGGNPRDGWIDGQHGGIGPGGVSLSGPDHVTDDLPAVERVGNVVEVELRTVVAFILDGAVAVLQTVNGDDPSALRLHQRPFIIPDIGARDDEGSPAALVHGLIPRMLVHRGGPDRGGIITLQCGGRAGRIHRTGNRAVVQVAGDIRKDGIAVRDPDDHDQRIGLRSEIPGDGHPVGIVPACADDPAARRTGGRDNL